MAVKTASTATEASRAEETQSIFSFDVGYNPIYAFLIPNASIVCSPAPKKITQPPRKPMIVLRLIVST